MMGPIHTNNVYEGHFNSETRDVIKLALPGLRHLVDWWDLPTRLGWSLAPDRGALGYQTGSLAGRMAFGRLRRPRLQN